MKMKMKRLLALAMTAVMAISLPAAPVKAAERTDIIYTPEQNVLVSNLGNERSELFNDGWKFFLGDSSNAQDVNFNDSLWRVIDLPHDYSIEQEFTTKGEAESGFLLGGTGWYRKSFTLSEESKDKTITIDFDGVYMNATVYVNGNAVGQHPYGYTGFSFDISDYVVCDGSTQNVIAVKVDHKTPSSRFYSGSGIYRDVHIGFTDKVHVSRYGTTITTPNLETQQKGNVDVTITTAVQNDSDTSKNVTIRNTIYDSSDNKVSESVSQATSLPADTIQNVEQVAVVSGPSLWSVDNPTLYYCVTEIMENDSILDTYQSEFGFRYFEMNKDTGFSLNGTNMKLKGVCMHHDQGSLGAKAYSDAIERQIKMLKEMGCNSIRVTHNPAATVMVELANRYGMLLIDEAFDTWSYPKNGNTYDYNQAFHKNIEEGNEIIGGNPQMTWAEYDMKEMVSRGKNAPSIIMWSIGNEVQEGISGNVSDYPDIAANLIQWGKEIDDTRPYTFGDNKIKSNDGIATNIAERITELGGIVGLNYNSDSDYDSRRRAHPNWTLVGSETASSISSRGVYYTKGQDNQRFQLTGYDKKAVPWGRVASQAWFDVITRDFVAGEYVWTGFDYIGEPTPWNGTGTGSPNGAPKPNSSYFGIIDTAGIPKDNYYLYQSMWNDEVHTLHLLPSWDRDKISLSGGKAEVVVYSDAAKVELYLNGLKIEEATSEENITPAGHQYRMWQGKTAHNNQYATFDISYTEGTLSAKAYDKQGKVITDTAGRSSVTTSGTPAKLTLEGKQSYADYTTIDADGKSLSYIEVDVQDQNDVIAPNAATPITFTVEGDGELVGTDNGDPSDTTCYTPESTTSTVRKAFSGKAMAIVKSTDHAGKFTLTASAEGLESDSIEVQTLEVPGMDREGIASYTMPLHGYVGLGVSSVSLPPTAMVSYKDGQEKVTTIQWSDYDKSKLTEVGTFIVRGTIENGDYPVKVSFMVHVAGTIVGAENYSGITAQGTLPTLPKTRSTVLNTGNKYEEFPVVWDDTISPEDFAKPGDIISMKGTVTALGSTYPVTASIRVAEPVYGDSSNIAPQYLDLTESCITPSDSLISITNGKYNSTAEEPGERWTNWQTRQDADSPVITFTWATIHLINEVKLYYYKEDIASSQFPTSVRFEYSNDGSTWQEIGYKPVTPVSAPAATTYELDREINPIALRMVLSHDVGKFIGLTEAEIMSIDVSYKQHESSALSNIYVAGKPLPGFTPETTEYTVTSSGAITAASDANAAITILPNYEETSRILVTSEDGKSETMYTLHLKTAENNYPKTVSLSADKTDVNKNDRVQLSVNVLDRDDKDITSQSQVTYEVTGSAVCSSSGLLTFTGPGEVSVRAAAAFNGKVMKSAPIKIAVKDVIPVKDYIASITVKAAKAKPYKSEKIQLTTKVLNQRGEDITKLSKVTYQITGPASVNSSGILTFKGTGKVTVIGNASYQDSSKTSPSTTLTVLANKKLSKPSMKSVSSTITKSGSAVKIVVKRTVKGADTYTVYRKAGSKLMKIGTADKKGVTYDKNPLTTGKKAEYLVIASSRNVKYLNSAKSTVKSITLPKAPTKVKTVKKGRALRITWNKVTKAKSYVVFRSEKKDSGFIKIAEVKKGTSYTDTKAKKNKRYYYSVVTVDSGKRYSGMKVSAKTK